MKKSLDTPTEKSFGLVFTAVFAIIGAWPVIFGGGKPFYWAFSVATLFLAASFVAPRLLRPLNLIWFKLGLALHHVANPVLMALIYFGAFVPMGLVIRLARKDFLRLKRRTDQDSYWILREPPGPAPKSMSKQY
jgi:predicted membrane metal-binding protein